MAQQGHVHGGHHTLLGILEAVAFGIGGLLVAVGKAHPGIISALAGAFVHGLNHHH